MIDLAQFRELIYEPDLTDEEVVELRAYFYAFAQMIVECYEASRHLAPAGTICPTR